jgi:hypothetical protein
MLIPNTKREKQIKMIIFIIPKGTIIILHTHTKKNNL